MSSIDEDRDTILKLHKDWWEANHQLVIPQMETVFPAGDSYLMFNMNGHPYFGIEEKVALWKHYQGELDIGEFPNVQIMRLTIQDDIAWLAAEGVVPLRIVGASGTGSATWQTDNGVDYDPFPVRATEIYQRDDGNGNPVWKMWHFHCSGLPASDEPRPGVGDTRDERGLGRGPGITPLRVTATGVRRSGQ